MKRIVALLAFTLVGFPDCEDPVCVPGETQTCLTSQGDGVQTCNYGGESWGTCEETDAIYDTTEVCKKKEAGELLAACGCWGPASNNMTYANARCCSGQAVALACDPDVVGWCAGNTYAWFAQCL